MTAPTPHEIVSFDAQPFRITLKCGCGREFEHSTEDGARRRHFIHERIETTREAVRQGRERAREGEG